MSDVSLACGCETWRADAHNFDTVWCQTHKRDVDFTIVNEATA